MADNAPQPTQGGSYTRDPDTGELTRTEYTAPPVPEGAQPEAQPDTPEA